MAYTTEQLKALEKKLVSDLDSVRRVMALDANPDLIRVSELLRDIKPAPETRNLFESTAASPSPAKNNIKKADVIGVVMKFATPFKFSDVQAAILKEHPGKELKPFVIPATLRMLREAKRIKEVAPREGRNGATYAKV